jgi:hypothetical protein
MASRDARVTTVLSAAAMDAGGGELGEVVGAADAAGAVGQGGGGVVVASWVPEHAERARRRVGRTKATRRMGDAASSTGHFMSTVAVRRPCRVQVAPPFMLRHEPPPAYLTSRFGLQVRFCETDLMGIVHHANYLTYFEAGRVDWLHRRGISYDVWTKQGIHLPVVETHLRYRKAARFDDELWWRRRARS